MLVNSVLEENVEMNNASEAMIEALHLARALARIADKDALFDRLHATMAASGSSAEGDVPAAAAEATPATP